jgi:hypothetical protein
MCEHPAVSHQVTDHTVCVPELPIRPLRTLSRDGIAVSTVIAIDSPWRQGGVSGIRVPYAMSLYVVLVAQPAP